uniref:Beta/gamma crystallin 'Greek key' domain-containing protein n=1 Tax=Sinocyclocheilus rhinocerous TaxID=307959 RepID=A0A673GNB9_9TELE
MPPTALTNEKNTTTSDSANKRTTNEETISPQASTNETTSKKKTAPPPASSTETISATLGSSDDKNKPPPASINETISALPDPANDKTMPPTALTNEKNTTTSDSANKRTTNEETISLQASTNETTSKKKTAPPPASSTETISATLGSNDDKNKPPPIVIFEHHQFSGQSFEFYRDQPDATHMQLSSVISIKVVRGCWILYEKPGFEGRCIALEEEGVTELPNQWAEEGEEISAPVVIGSIRLAVRDYTPPRIELFTEPAGRGRSSEYVDDTEEVGSFSRPQSTGSIKVHSGLWLVYSDPGFQGLLAVLEAGEYPFPEDWGFPSPAVGSLRPVRMVRLTAVLYEKAGLEGRCVEVQGDVFSFARTETDLSDPDNHGLNCVESLKILGGLWVGYDGEGFEGQQFVLEEGEYLDWTDWGGTGEKLLSLRPVFMDFSSPHMKMFSEPDFSERGVSIDLLEPLDNAMNTRYGPQTRSIEVLAGVWVAFEGPGLSGQQYVLEKGLYGSPEDWGSSHSRICSAVPVILVRIELFSESGFGGTSVLLQDSLPTIPGGFSVLSCRVHAGSWLAFSGECFSDRQCVLEEGFYPDLRMMGFSEPDASVLSLQPTGLELSVPALLLFERSGLRGRRTPLKTASVNLQLTHSCSRVSSVLVLGGMWVLYEDHNFRGSQLLLKPGAVPDWPKLSSWLRIGSLRPLTQKQVNFRLRSKEAGLLMSVSGSLDDIKLMRIQVSEETGGAEQIWTYQDGQLQLICVCVCLSVSGVLMSGSRVVLSAEPGKPQQLWSVTSDGIIQSHARPELVLEVKGQRDPSSIIIYSFIYLFSIVTFVI